METCGQVPRSVRRPARTSFLPGIFPLFPLFPLFFDGTERQYDRKNRLAVKVRSLNAGLSNNYSTNVLF